MNAPPPHFDEALDGGKPPEAIVLPDAEGLVAADATAPSDASVVDIDEQEIHLFLLSGRLLLEYSEATPMVERTLYALAANLGREIRITAGYRDLTIFLKCGDHFEGRVSRYTPELKVNMRIITEVHDLLRRLECRQATLTRTVAKLERLTESPPQVNRWHAVVMLAAAAASLAGVFGGDGPCIFITALATGLGVLLRQILAHHRFNMFFLPFAAALLGALLGGLFTFGGWTRTPDLCLLVPSLVLVPGVHMLNAAFDLFDNHMPMALARTALSVSMMGAIAFGLLLGTAVTGHMLPVSSPPAMISLPAAITFAALASAGFGVYFNVPLRLLWVCVLCGLVAHGVRSVGIESGLDLAWSTLLASATVGVLTSLMRERFHAPFAAIAFGAVVPLVPGALILRVASGTSLLVSEGATATPQQFVDTAIAGIYAVLVLLAIGVGLLAPVVLVRRSPRMTACRGSVIDAN